MLALTNKEVQLMFEDMIRDWFAESDGSYNDFIKALLLDDTEAMSHYIRKKMPELSLNLKCSSREKRKICRKR